MAIPSTPRKKIGLSEALAVLDAAYEIPGGWMTRCPAHDDGRQSLKNAEGDNGKWLAHCFAGCDFQEVSRIIRQRIESDYQGSQDTQGVRRARPGRFVDRDYCGIRMPVSGPAIDRIAAPSGSTVYEYLTADGDHAFFVIRQAHKRFVQARYDGAAGLVWTREGAPEVPYRLPELIEAVKRLRRIWIVEGEKDVDRLRALGETATCNSGGAGKWSASFARYFQGAVVAIVADNDPAGLKHAQLVYDSLKNVARTIRIGRARVGKDASDHLDAGLGLADLIPVSTPTPERTPS